MFVIVYFLKQSLAFYFYFYFLLSSIWSPYSQGLVRHWSPANLYNQTNKLKLFFFPGVSRRVQQVIFFLSSFYHNVHGMTNGGCFCMMGEKEKQVIMITYILMDVSWAVLLTGLCIEIGTNISRDALTWVTPIKGWFLSGPLELMIVIYTTKKGKQRKNHLISLAWTFVAESHSCLKFVVTHVGWLSIYLLRYNN